MKLRISIAAAVLILTLAVGAYAAKDFWDEPFQKWSRNDVVKMLTNSPWAQVKTFIHKAGGNTGAGGEKEIAYKVSVRFFSSLPVREAYVRKLQIMNNYDQADEATRSQIDARFSKALKLDMSKQVIVALEYETNDPEAMRELKRYFESKEATVERLKQSVYLISQRLGRVELSEYYPPSADGTGAKFIFPRMVGDKPVALPGDKELKFDMWLPWANERVFVTFKPADMVYKGDISY